MLLKTTITFIFIFSFVRLGGNIFLLPFYPRFSVLGERYRSSGHYKEQTEPVNVVEQTDEEDSESERESEMSSSECEMSEEETFRSINRIIETPLVV
jgi:hypothetical protein